MNRTRANALLLLAGAIWGMGFVAQSTAMASIGPLLFVGLRFAVATAVTLPFAFREARHAPHILEKSDMMGFFWIGVCLFAGMIFQQVGLLTTSVTNTGFLTGLYVVFVPFLVVIFLRQQPHPIVWPCAALAFAGIWLLSGGSILEMKRGDVLVIICAVFWACQVLLIGVYARRSNRPLALSVVQFAICAIAGLGAAAFLEPVSWPAIADAMPEILYSGIFSSGLAFSLQAIGQRHTTSAQAAIFLSSEALFAAIFGALFLGESIPAIGYLGCVLIFAAILAVEIIPAARAKQSHP
ncbi:MAG: DMT family transporter [Alphaproteobacteria bacterium]|nr:DMT family transporter [Alphaproteobacteria bacterium]